MKIAVALLFLTLFALMTALSWPTESSRRGYEKIMTQAEVEKKAETTHKQERRGVRKDLWVSDHGVRLHTFLEAESSDLILEDLAGVPELVEIIPRFRLLMQEELFPDKQLIREVNAADGRFYYLQEKITAKRAMIARYMLPGAALPELIAGEKPLFKGVADSAEVTFSGGIKFHAKQIKATVFGEAPR
ncbi:MAG: hypothetical protein KDK48_05950 [Chlamydiia bacterium]|nr:hypothetical protein [Chlamydiia bacterium]